MPVYLRKFYTNQLIKTKETEQSQIEKAQSQQKSSIPKYPKQKMPKFDK